MAWIVKIGLDPSMTQTELENNATEFYGYFNSKGFTIESISGMLGNLQQESQINPGCKQKGGDGWGLIQWTPHTNLTDYASAQGSDWAAGEIQTQLMWEEIINGYSGQWIPKPALGYSYTGDEFSKLTDVSEACKAYLYERERAGVQALSKRLTYASNWYEYLTGVTPPTPPTPPASSKRKGMPVWMMCRPLF